MALVAECWLMGRLATPVGTLLVVSDATLCLRALDWADHEARLQRLLRLQYRQGVALQNAVVPNAIEEALAAYFAGQLTALNDLPVELGGTPFQREVWAGLRTIPAGTTQTYGGLAAAIGRPSAVRAVGLANGANPIAIVVPCHRVIGANGTLTGYAGGLPRKQWLLAHEGRWPPAT